MSTRPHPVELAERSGDGFSIELLWDRLTGRLWVNVRHESTGEDVRVDASPENALDVFYHPFAYCLPAAA